MAFAARLATTVVRLAATAVWLATIAVWLAALASSSAQAQDATPTPAPDANAILERVKAGLRAVERPPYVVYTLVRRDTVDGVPDFLNSYTLRVWCRTADRAALSRRVYLQRTIGAPEFIVPAFDGPIDPGPPTADLLDVVRRAPPTPDPVVSAIPVIGTISVIIESSYHVTFAGYDGPDFHLRLEARRDPSRNRLTDLYVDRESYDLHRAVAHDHLYKDGRAIPERFEIVFGAQDGMPLITAIHGYTDYGALDHASAGIPLHEVDYRFEDVTFPADLPAWYFDPLSYGAHQADLPQ